MKLYQTVKDSNFLLHETDLLPLHKGYEQQDTTTYTDAGELHKIYMDESKTF
jgi:glucosylceramidase